MFVDSPWWSEQFYFGNAFGPRHRGSGLHGKCGTTAKRSVTPRRTARILLPVGRKDILEHRTIRYERTHGPFSDPSGPAVTDFDRVSLHNDRDSPGPAGAFEHFLEFRRVPLHIEIDSLFAVRPPGVGCVASTVLPVNNDFFIHETLQFLFSGILYLLRFFFVKIFGEPV